MQTQTKQTVATVSPAKLNLTFDIVGTFPDGYHEVVTIMQAVDLEDRLTFEFDQASELSISLAASYVGNPGSIPLDESNLIARAARLFHDHVAPAIGYSLKIDIEKRIPITAGLGGGSGNAAATLLAMNHYFGQPVPDVDLVSLGSKLGADVPFFLDGGTQIGLKRGDMLSPTPLGEPLNFVVAHPQGLEISTRWIYDRYDQTVRAVGSDDDFEHPDLYECKDALASNDFERAGKIFGNVFEPIVFKSYPGLIRMRDRMLELGCLCAHLTGSGPTIYGLVEDAQKAENVAFELNRDQCEPGRAAWERDGLHFNVFAAQSLRRGAHVLNS